jgi:hypothetical protein
MTLENQSLQFIHTDFKIGKEELITKSLLIATKLILNLLLLSELNEKVHVPLLPPVKPTYMAGFLVLNRVLSRF